MFDPTILFDAFKGAGMLDQATLLGPSPVSFDVGFLQPENLIMGEAVQTSDIVIEFVTASSPQLRTGTALVIKGQAYRVRQPPNKQGDGYYSRATLETTVVAP